MTHPENDDTDTAYRIIETTAIDQVTHVRLYEETWSHIAAQHPEFSNRLPSLEHAVIDTIRNPTEVYRSRTDTVSGYVFRSSNNLKANRAMAVPIRVVGEGTSARVTTAMFRGEVKGELLYEGTDEQG
jgi:hypothetical protein